MLINGRTPEEIKHVTEWACFSCGGLECDECEYRDACTVENRDRAVPDALALIQRLEAAQPKWNSVKDRLPESHDEKADCFLVTDGEFIWMAYYACKEWQFAQCTDSPYVIDWTEITHWMPLPQPPEEDM